MPYFARFGVWIVHILHVSTPSPCGIGVAVIGFRTRDGNGTRCVEAVIPDMIAILEAVSGCGIAVGVSLALTQALGVELFTAAEKRSRASAATRGDDLIVKAMLECLKLRYQFIELLIVEIGRGNEYKYIGN